MSSVSMSRAGQRGRGGWRRGVSVERLDGDLGPAPPFARPLSCTRRRQRFPGLMGSQCDRRYMSWSQIRRWSAREARVLCASRMPGRSQI